MLHSRYLSKLGGVLALSLPVVAAEAKSGKSKDEPKSVSRKLKPSKLPLYEDPEDIFSYEYHGKQKTRLEEGISFVRKELESAYDASADTRERVATIFETGKAHSLATANYVWDEESIAAKVGLITTGGLLGLLIGGRKKGFLKKILATSVAATGAAALVYPLESVKIGREAFNNAEDYSIIAYNFIIGVKPQNDLKPAPPAVPPKKASPVAPAPPPEKSDEPPVVPPKAPAKDVVVNVTPKPPPSTVEEDVGQSNPEDKDMYTTRS